MVRVEGARKDIYPVVEAVGMWESRRDFQRVWEAGFMAFHAFHTLSFPWPAFRVAMLDKPICRHPVQCAGLATRCSSLVNECIMAIVLSPKTPVLKRFEIVGANARLSVVMKSQGTLIVSFKAPWLPSARKKDWTRRRAASLPVVTSIECYSLDPQAPQRTGEGITKPGSCNAAIS
jgi:hypothetical protein